MSPSYSYFQSGEVGMGEDIRYVQVFYVYGSSTPGHLVSTFASTSSGVHPEISLECR